LLEKQSEIKSQIKALGYRTLDKPIHHGYNAYFTLREDIAKRDDRLSWAYQYFIDNFSTQPWSRTIDFKRKNKKSKEVIKPEFIRISEKQYNSYVPWAQEVLKTY
jgi:hypothetical protein